MSTGKVSRPVDLLTEAYDLNQRRKFVVKNDAGQPVLDLYFKPITRADRQRVNMHAKTDDALEVSTLMLCHMAELQDGTKAFAVADAPKLQRKLPEKVLNDVELFLFGLAGEQDFEEAKND